MNCKPGDLAIVIKSLQGNEGRLVRCIEHVLVNWASGVMDSWVIDAQLKNRDPRGRDRVPDAWLRPIRDPGTDAKDETLQWLPVPSREKEQA